MRYRCLIGCCLGLLLAQAPVELPAADAGRYRLIPGDFNGDRRTDLLLLARDPWASSGILLADGSGRPVIVQQRWRSDYLGIDWSATALRAVTGSFSDAACVSGHMSVSCNYPEDLLLQMPGDEHFLLFTDHATTSFQRIQQRIDDPQLGLAWSTQAHLAQSGYFNADNYHDLFLQAATAGERSAVVLSTSLTGFDDPGQPLETWANDWAGLRWSAEDALVHVGDFNGDGLDDLLVQGRTVPGDPYAPGVYGIVVGRNGGGFGAGDSATSAWMSWQRRGFLAPDWSPETYVLHVGNFNNDRYDDLLLQPVNPADDALLILFGPREAAAQWTVSRLSAAAAGQAVDAQATPIVLADFDGDGRDELLLPAAGPGGQAAILKLAALPDGAEATVERQTLTLPALDPAPAADGFVAGTAAGASPGSFRVDPTGAATYRLPIRVPPGVRGMQPAISLDYNHRRGDGLAGVGWQLGGLPVIQRCGTLAEPAADGFADGVDLDASDRFCLDGQRLVPAAAAGEFRTEIDSLRRVRAHGDAGGGPAWFSVEEPGGRVLEFGHSPDAQIHPRGPGQADAVLAYAISSAVDAWGNRIDYRWHQDDASSAWRPEEIRWRNAAGTDVGRLLFTYADRLDTRSGWLQGYRVARPWRLTGIRSYTRPRGGTAADTPVREYRLRYGYNPASGLPQLREILECELTTGSCLGATELRVETGERGFVANSAGTGVAVANREGLQLLDVTGNGVPDHVYLQQTAPGRYRWTVRIDGAKGQLAASLPDAVDWDDFDASNVNYKGIPGDYDGDGHADLLQASADRRQPGAVIQLLAGAADGLHARATRLPLAGQGFFEHGLAADVDGDGRDDLATAANAELRVFLSEGRDFSGTPRRGRLPAGFTRVLPIEGAALHRIEFDGDGRADLLALAAACESSPWVGEFCTEFRWVVFGLPDPLSDPSGELALLASLPADAEIAALRVLDSNGDRLSDLLVAKAPAAGWTLYVGTGVAFQAQPLPALLSLPAHQEPPPAGEIPPLADAPPDWRSTTLDSVTLDAALLTEARVLDYDHDGRQDLLIQRNGRLQVLLFGGDLQLAPRALIDTGAAAPPSQHRGKLRVADLGGDGLPDLLSIGSGGNYRVHHGRGPLPGRLIELRDGLGARTKISYAPLTDRAVYLGHLDFAAGGAPAWPYRHFAGPISVVRESAVSSGRDADDMVVTAYQYGGAKWHAAGRGFLGFSERRAWNLNQGVVTLNRFRQRFPFTGMVSLAQQRLPENPDAAQPVAIRIPWVGVAAWPSACNQDAEAADCLALFRPGERPPPAPRGGLLISESRSEFGSLVTQDTPRGRAVLPYVRRVTDLAWPVTTGQGIGSAPQRRIVTDYEPDGFPVDAWGNPRRIVVTVDDGAGGDWQETITDNEWLNREDRWCPGLLQQAIVQRRAAEPPASIRWREYSYGSDCAVSEEVLQRGATGLELHSSYLRDAYGNRVLERRQLAGQPAREQRMSFGGEWHGRFLTALVSAGGELIRQEWDARFGTETRRLAPAVAGEERPPLSVSRFDGFGRLLARRGADDAAGEYLRSWCADGGCASPAASYRLVVLKADGHEATLEFDRLQRLVHVSETGFDGQPVHQEQHFDSLGRLYSWAGPYRDGGPRCFGLRRFDLLNRVVFEQRPQHAVQCTSPGPPSPDADTLAGGGLSLSIRHDLPAADGLGVEARVTTGSAATGPVERRRLVVRDALGRTVRSEETVGGTVSSLRYRWYANGNLREVVDPEGRATRFTYDGLGRPASVDDPVRGLWLYRYSGDGRLLSQRDGRSQWTHYRYDAEGRILQRRYSMSADAQVLPDDRLTDWSWGTAGGATGRLVAATGPYRAADGVDAAVATMRYRYDRLGRLSDSVRGIGRGSQRRWYWTSQVRDRFGRLQRLIYPSLLEDGSADAPGSQRFAVEYDYGPWGQLAGLRSPDGAQRYWELQRLAPGGQVSEVLADDGRLLIRRDYDPASGRPTGLYAERDGQPLQHLLYQWTDRGDLALREDRLHGVRERFAYDELQRLVLARIENDQGLVAEHRYAYRADGSLASRDDGARSYVYAANRPQAPSLLLAGTDAITFSYDANGNRAGRGAQSLTWTEDNLPRDILSPDGSLAFDYGPARGRVRQRLSLAGGDREIRYVGAALEIERSAGQAARHRRRLFAGREAVARLVAARGQPPRLEYLLRDHLGSITGIVGPGDFHEFAYDPHGLPRDPAAPDSAASHVGRGYGDHEHLALGGLVHMQGRLFDPELGLFLSPDPFVQFPLASQGLQRYAYLLHRPLSFTDPAGYGIGDFFERLAKKLFFAAPWIIIGNGIGSVIAGPIGEALGVAIGFNVTGFTQPAGLGQGLPTVLYLTNPSGPGLDQATFPDLRELGAPVGLGGTLSQGSVTRLIMRRIVEGLRGAQRPLSQPDMPAEAGLFPDGIGGVAERIGDLVRAVEPRREEREPGRIYVTGHRVGGVGPWHTAIEYEDDLGTYWISAGPEGFTLEGYESLVGGVGTYGNGERPGDLPERNATLGEVRPPPGIGNDEYFEQLRHGAEVYCNCADYDLFPAIGGGFNSNSYTRGLIEATGGSSDFDFSRVVGGERPLPPEYFGY